MQEIKKINLSLIEHLDNYLELITYGFTNPMPDSNEGPWKITAKDVINGKINYDTARKTTIDSFENDLTPKSKPKINDILLTKDGTLGRLAIVDQENICVNQSVAVLRPNKKIIPQFLYYLLSSPYYQKTMLNDSDGSVLKHIYITRVKKMDVQIPDLTHQKKIIQILELIDNKIDVLIKLNKNLEQLIKYIYINWFEEFEPFKDKDFYDTKLGSIPVGWDVKPLQEFIKFQEGPGIRNWQYVEEDGINFLNIRCIQNNDLVLDTANMISKEEANGKYAHFMLNEWDLVISSSGTLGRYAIVREEHLPLCLNTSIIRFTPMHSFDHYAYVYSYLTSRGFYHYLLTMGSGSVQLNFGPTHLKQIDLIVPPENILKKYNDLIFPLIEQMVTIKSEISKLTKLRDTLLPKLMSGEIDVSKINCDLELKYNYMKYLFNQIHTPMSKSVV